ncbi:OmpA family protein [Sinimarinibacterium sp. CAU 1509]|uniref:OmpA family protein n=1 Tax=Sinimarinibacterium sp. CAU 1509 TaxID=2562283 RepID=UPI0010AD423E|nr:OmpA family protein [Sinimarinibacterium sp. CAU 1509]TJY56237.1 OmpA family protein [Sinimarinibacterium sp. CAU 1509]
MKHLCACCAVTLAGLFVVPANAHETQLTSSSYVGILGGYTFADEMRGNDNLDYATGVQVLYGTAFEDSRWGYELGFALDNYETDKTAGIDLYRNGFGADLTYTFGNRFEGALYLLGGLAAAYNDTLPDSEDDWSWTGNVGIGVVSGAVTEAGQIRLRGEARYVYDDFQEGYWEPRINLGIEIPLFEAHEAEAAAPQEVVRTVEVSTGLLDADGDGVVDDKDQCPNTPTGDRVAGNGCTLDKIIELKGVTFEFDKIRLRPDAQTILDWATDILKKYPDMQVEIAGHTDNIGTDEYNQALAEGRAQAVKQYFVDHGVPDGQMSVKGYGESEPRDTNDTEEGRERNRRVELRILN